MEGYVGADSDDVGSCGLISDCRCSRIVRAVRAGCLPLSRQEFPNNPSPPMKPGGLALEYPCVSSPLRRKGLLYKPSGPGRCARSSLGAYRLCLPQSRCGCSPEEQSSAGTRGSHASQCCIDRL